jgi:CHAT domain-containing protein
VEWGELRRALPRDTAFVDFFRVHVLDLQARGPLTHWRPAHYAAWVIPGAPDRPVRLLDLGEAGPIDAAVADVRRALHEAPARLTRVGERKAEAELAGPLGVLAARALHPLLRDIGAAERWVLSPDAALWLVPWAALPLPGGAYTVEKHAVSLAVSGRDLAAPAGVGQPDRPLILADPDFDLGADAARAASRRLLAGDGPARRGGGIRSDDLAAVRWPRLPGTAAEARAIAPQLERYAHAPARVYTGAEALEGVFKAARRPRAVVLSTHGFFLDAQDDAVLPAGPLLASRGLHLVPRQPAPPAAEERPRPPENPLLRCGLVLAGANRHGDQADGDDGILTGLEIVGTDLRGTDLVVLSACDTGVGRVRNGEGVAGLRQAFQLAGARAVVATLWPIPDAETTRLTTMFFDGLAGGKGKADALRSAQLAVIRGRRARGRSAHPFYWAAFTLTGQWR